MKNILIVDDHTLFLESLTDLLKKNFPSFNFVSINNPLDAIEKLKSQKFDLAILDINMPKMSGLELLEHIKLNYGEITTTMLSMEDSEETILESFKIGCNGYLLKDIHPKNLFIAIESLIEDGTYLSPRVQQLFIKNLQKEKKNITLTETEIYAVELFCSELTYKEIADKMNISVKTMEKHRQNIFNKLQVNNRVGVVIYALKNKIFNANG